MGWDGEADTASDHRGCSRARQRERCRTSRSMLHFFAHRLPVAAISTQACPCRRRLWGRERILLFFLFRRCSSSADHPNSVSSATATARGAHPSPARRRRLCPTCTGTLAPTTHTTYPVACVALHCIALLSSEIKTPMTSVSSRFVRLTD